MKKPSSGPPEDSANSSKKNIVLVAAAAISALTLFAGLKVRDCMDEKAARKADDHADVHTPDVLQKAKKPVTFSPELPQVDLPVIHTNSNPPKFEAPIKTDLPEEKNLKSLQSTAREIVASAPAYFNKLWDKNNLNIVSKIHGDFTMEIVNKIKKIDPSYALYFDEFLKNWKHDYSDLHDEINRVLVPGGFFLRSIVASDVKSFVEFYPIQSVSSAYIKDAHVDAIIPIYHLAPSIFSTMQPDTKALLGQFQAGTFSTGQIFISRTGMEEKIKDALNFGRERGIFKIVDEKKLVDEELEETAAHEATHFYLLRRFPNIFKKNDDVTVHTNQTIKAGKLSFSLSDPRMQEPLSVNKLNELFATGMGLKNCSTAQVAEYGVYYRLEESGAGNKNYLFVGHLSLLLSLAYADESPGKNALLQNKDLWPLYNQKGAVIKAAFAGNFNAGRTQAVGDAMAKIAYRLLEQQDRAINK